MFPEKITSFRGRKKKQTEIRIVLFVQSKQSSGKHKKKLKTQQGNQLKEDKTHTTQLKDNY